MNEQNNDMKSQLPVATDERHVAESTAAAMGEIQAAVLMAKKWPRDEKQVWGALMGSCQRKTLAIKAEYNFPRGGKPIKGPSVNITRVAAQKWGNIWTGLDVIGMDDDYVHIRGWAWDIETGARYRAEDRFKKLVYRKRGGWIVPDERDLRELINRRGAILERNCTLKILPSDLIEDAVGVCRKTITQGMKDPKSEAKNLILQFQAYNVTVDMLSKYLGHDEWDVTDCVDLTAILNSLADGNSKREDYFKLAKDKPAEATLTDDDIKPGDATAHQSHTKPKKDGKLL